MIQESIEHKFDSFTVNLFAKLSLNSHLPNTFVNTSTNPLLSSDHSVFAVEDTALCFQQDEKTQYSLFVGKEGIMRRLPDDYVFPCMTFALFISYWFCGDKSKNLVPICVIDRKDVKLKGQKMFCQNEEVDEFGGSSHKMRRSLEGFKALQV